MLTLLLVFDQSQCCSSNFWFTESPVLVCWQEKMLIPVCKVWSATVFVPCSVRALYVLCTCSVVLFLNQWIFVLFLPKWMWTLFFDKSKDFCYTLFEISVWITFTLWITIFLGTTTSRVLNWNAPLKLLRIQRSMPQCPDNVPVMLPLLVSSSQSVPSVR